MADPDSDRPPLSARMSVMIYDHKVTVNATLLAGAEIDRLIRILTAYRPLISDDEARP